ncbi:MAG: response regulator transcription factor [Burkholderiales bacterium]|nr:MAG: response regulator transcription factor [Burkholderiales bacterium]
MINCLLVEDDVEIRALLEGYLNGYGMAVTAVGQAQAMREALRSRSYDVMLLDLMLPDGNGLDICRQLRADSSMAIIMLTAQGDPVSRVIGLELGADDYLGKPFEPRELVARIHAVLRRSRGGVAVKEDKGLAPVARFQGWTFDRVKRRLTSPEDVMVDLSSAEFRLLSVLVDHAGQVLSRDRLLDMTQPPGAVLSDRSVDLTVSRLRHKLRDAGQAGGGLIRTMRGEGYLFATQVRA